MTKGVVQVVDIQDIWGMCSVKGGPCNVGDAGGCGLTGYIEYMGVVATIGGPVY
jgi:hypothetical protein